MFLTIPSLECVTADKGRKKAACPECHHVPGPALAAFVLSSFALFSSLNCSKVNMLLFLIYCLRESNLLSLKIDASGTRKHVHSALKYVF